MPDLRGFTDNPLVTRTDLLQAAAALIRPLNQYKSHHGTRIKLAAATGTIFDEVAAQLEGFARPLLVVPHLLEAVESSPAQFQDLNIESWISGLVYGVNPACNEFWGDLVDSDQKMVEMESICYALLTDATRFVPGDAESKKNLIQWLQQINSRKLPQNNWLWFRVIVNLTLTHVLGVLQDEVEEIVRADFEILDSFDIGDGWSSDGLWNDDRKQADYYSGSFAIQYAQLLYVRYFGSHDGERTNRYKIQAREFATKYWRYFDVDGMILLLASQFGDEETN